MAHVKSFRTQIKAHSAPSRRCVGINRDHLATQFLSLKPLQASQTSSPRSVVLHEITACCSSGATAGETGNEATPPETTAWSLLNEYTKLEARGLANKLRDSKDKRRALANALLTVTTKQTTESSSSCNQDIILGVLASDIRLAIRALRDYCDALELQFIPPECRVPGVDALPLLTGSVYIKYIQATGVCYAVRYEGRDRGVLVQIGQQQVGHLPLGLWDEDMNKAAPTL